MTAPDRCDHPERGERPPSRLLLVLGLGQLTSAGLLMLLLAAAALFTVLGAGVMGQGGCGGPEYQLGGRGIPPTLIPIYEAGAARFRLGARGPGVLAAINKIETDFGRDLSTSTAGAVGWMQFEPSTWALYATDGNGDGVTDPNNPSDAIFTAARYLAEAGAPGDWRAAVYAYNHADWYVSEVLAQASSYAGGGTPLIAGVACAATPDANGRLARILAEANRIDALRSTYVYGGGHVTPAPATPPWDCSAAWSRLMQVAGFGIATMDSTGFMSWGDPGPGRYVTIYATPAHVYGTILGRPWGTSGGDNPRDPGGGPAWLPYRTNPVPDFPGGTPTVRHPPGL